MRAAIFHGPGNVTAGERPDATIKEPSDAVVRVVLACVCGSDLWYYRGDSQFPPGPIGHEFIGVVKEAWARCSTTRPTSTHRRCVRSHGRSPCDQVPGPRGQPLTAA